MFILFFLLWLLMTGQLTIHACLWGLAVSAVMSWFCWKFLGYHVSFPRPGRLWGWIRYLGYLLKEMLKAGFVVMRLVYTRGRNMRPLLVRFHTPLEAERARVILADSMDASLAEGLENSEFQQRLEQMEAGPWNR